MMKHLLNYYYVEAYEKELEQRGQTLGDFVNQLGLDGIEEFIYTMEKPEKSYADLVRGVHLTYWPCWMDFWLRKAKRLKQEFRNVIERNQYYREALSREEWLSVIRKNIGAAATEDPDYMVWHIADANKEEIFTYQFNYSDREVLTAAADVFNSVADEIPENVTVLFENLWWPGLRLTDVRNVRYFFERIERKNVGLLVDTGHLMNTNLRLKNEEEAADYVCRVLGKLGPYVDYIKAVHLNCSLSGKYQRSIDHVVPKHITSQAIWEHMMKLDPHQPFQTKAAKQILDCMSPNYVVHEMAYNTLAELQEKVELQLSNCR